MKKGLVIGVSILLIIVSLFPVFAQEEVYYSDLGARIDSRLGYDAVLGFPSESIITIRDGIITTSALQAPRFQGFIIQFKEEPVLNKKIELEKRAEENKRKVEILREVAIIGPPASGIYKAVTFQEEDIPKKLKEQKDRVLREHKNALEDIRSKVSRITGNAIDKENKDLTEYTDTFNGVFLNVTTQEAEEIKKSRYVKEVYPNYEVNITLMDSVPVINADDVWLLDEDGNNCAETGKECLTGKNVTIAIIDTGVDYTHEDLGGCQNDIPEENCFRSIPIEIGICSDSDGGLNYCNGGSTDISDLIGSSDDCLDNKTLLEMYCDESGHIQNKTFICPGECFINRCILDINTLGCEKVIGGYDFINTDNDPIDDHGHGTHCAGTAAGNGVLKGVAPDAKIYAYKVLDDIGRGSFAGIISAIEMAVDPNNDSDFSDHVDIISMSLGSSLGNPDNAISQAVDTAVESGVVVVVAAGNSGPFERTIGSPGTARKVITVGASDKNDVIAYFSSRGPVIWENGSIIKPDIIAPGVSICAAQWNDVRSDRKCFDDNHITMSGTSMATPHVAGAAALLKQKNPDWTPDEIKMALRSTAINIGEPITTQGYGRIDVLEAIQVQDPIIVELKTNGLLDENVDIIGTVKGNISNYKLEYSKGLNPSNWTILGIEYIEVTNGILGTLDTTLLDDGKYTLRIIAVDNNDVEYEDRTIIKVHNDPNFEIIGDMGFAAPYWGSLMVGDINGDDKKEIIAVGWVPGGIEGIPKIWAWNYDGTLVDGWPIEVDYWDIGIFGKLILSGPALSDIDDDGINEVLLVSGSVFYAFNEDGSNVDGFPYDIEPSGNDNYDIRFPHFSVGDVDGDGKKEIITIGSKPSKTINGTKIRYNGLFYIIKDDGAVLSGFPKILNVIQNSGPAIADINNDRMDEMVVASIGCSSDGSYCGQGEGDKLNVLDKNGNSLQGWPFGFPNISTVVKSPVVGDLDNDGELEILLAPPIKDKNKNETVWKWKLIVFGENGIKKSETVLREGIAPKYFDISLGDLDNDGSLEIIARDGGKVIVLDKNGDILSEKEIASTVPTYSIIGDIDGDNNKEILIWNRDELYILDSNLNLKEMKTTNNFWDMGGVVLSDLENDGRLDIVGVSVDGKVFVWRNIANYSPETFDWPMYMHDPQHTGCYGCDKITPQETECVREGETRGIMQECCEGLVNIRIYSDETCTNYVKSSWYCTNCGDGVCKYPEDKCNCKIDCVNETPITNCTDTDGGINLYIKGKTCEESKCFTDFCSGDYLFEYDCGWESGISESSHPGLGGSRFFCQGGCEDGACIKQQESVCIDSDGGKNYYIKGYVDVDGIKSYDECNPGPSTTKDDLLEYYCTDNPEEPAIGVLYKCEDGCEDGTCIEKETECVQEGETRGIMQECCEGLTSIRIYGDETCTNYVKSYWYCTNCGNGVCKYPEDKCNCKVDCMEEKKGDLVVKKYLEKCRPYDGYSIINLYKHPLIAGTALKPAKIVGDSEYFYDLEPGTYSIWAGGVKGYKAWTGYGYCNFEVLPGETTETEVEFVSGTGTHICKELSRCMKIECIDTDGGKEYYIKGKTTQIQNGKIIGIGYDSCRLLGEEVSECSGTNCWLDEFYCEGNIQSSISGVPCGYGCKDGACIRGGMSGSVIKWINKLFE